MNTRATLAYGEFRLELEGSQEFVSAHLDTWAGKLPPLESLVSSAARAADEREPAPTGDSEEPMKRARRQVARSSGPSCASRIKGMVEEGFFSTPRRSSEVTERLREKATPYQGKHVSAALIDVVRGGKLRRVKDGAEWSYVVP